MKTKTMKKNNLIKQKRFIDMDTAKFNEHDV